MKYGSSVVQVAETAQLFEAGEDELSGIALSPRGLRFGHPCSSNTCCNPEFYVGE